MSERRKNNFKSTGSVESRVDKSIKERNVQNKVKRDFVVAAKRLRVEEDDSIDHQSALSPYNIGTAIDKVKVRTLQSLL